MDYYLNKRRAIELGQLESWERRGHTLIHPENEGMIRSLLRNGLRLTGLLDRGLRNALRPVVRPLQFEFDSLPPAFDGFRVLHLSDIHGDQIDGLANAAASTLQGLQADLCVVTGDYRFEVRGPCDGVYPVMEAILNTVHTSHGVFAILGNHDSIEMIRPFERMGVRMLVNDATEIRRGDDSLWLVGVDDPHYYGCDDLPGAVARTPPGAFRILLAHSPQIVTEAAAHGIHLYLCGHTHGGQIRLPGIGAVFSNSSAPRKYIRGPWRYRTMQGYTSSGLGASGVPVRFNCPPEIGLLELRCSKDVGAAAAPVQQVPVKTEKHPATA